MELSTKSMHWADYLLLSLLLVLSVAIGLFQARGGRKGKGKMSREEYFLGGQKMRLLPVTFSVIASFLSAILIVGVPAEVYTYGARCLLFPTVMLSAPLVIAVTVIPVLYPLKMTSAYEYLELRFQSRSVRLLGSLLAMANMVCLSGIMSFAPSTALAAVSPIPVWLAIVLLIVITTIYTSLGGIKAVVWTDVFQVLVMFAGIIAILIKGTITQGLQHIIDVNREGGRFNMTGIFNIDPTERLSVYSLYIGGLVTFTSYIGYHQAFVQRFTSVPTLRKAQWTMVLTGCGFPIMMLLSSLNGFIIYSHYASEGCDPLIAKFISNTNQYVTYYVLDNFAAIYGFLGLLIAALFSATLSSLSSNINSLTALAWEDMLKIHLDKRLSDRAIDLLLKTIGGVYGLCIIAVGIGAGYVSGSLIQFAAILAGAINCPLLGLFYLGALFPWINWIGAFFGTTLGFGTSMWLALGANFFTPNFHQSLPFASTDNCTFSDDNLYLNSSGYSNFTGYSLETSTLGSVVGGNHTHSAESVTGVQQLYKISFLYIGLVGMLVQCVVANIVSFITGHTDPHTVDPRYLLVNPRWICCLKRRFQRVPINDKEMDVPMK